MLHQIIRRVYIFIVLVNSGFALAQVPIDSIKGRVFEATGNTALESVTVILLRGVDSSVVKFQLSEKDGGFLFEVERKEGYILKVSYVGYSSQYLHLNALDFSRRLEILLKPSSQRLEEIIVKGKQSIKVRGDTVVYNAAVYRDSTERKVTDLLKKIPGIDVSETGDVTVNGQQIRTVLIDGDNLAGRNYKVLTGNLSAGVIDNVEVIYKYLENPLLRDVFDSQDIAINLTVKLEAKGKLNGETELGGGVKSRYDLDANVIGLFKKLKTLAFLNGNNTGRPFQYTELRPSKQGTFSIESLLDFSSPSLSTMSTGGWGKDITRLKNSHLLASIFQWNLSQRWKATARTTNSGERFSQSNLTVFDYNDDSLDFRQEILRKGLTRQNAYSFRLTGQSGINTRWDFTAAMDRLGQEVVTELDGDESFSDRPFTRKIFFSGVLTRRLPKSTVGILEFKHSRSNQSQLINIQGSGDIIGMDTLVQFSRYDQNVSLVTASTFVSGKILSKRGRSKYYGEVSFLSTPSYYDQTNTTESELLRLKYIASQSDVYSRGQYSYETSRNYVWLVSGQVGLISREVEAVANVLIDGKTKPYGKLSFQLTKNWNAFKRLTVSYIAGQNVPTTTALFPTPRFTGRYTVQRGEASLAGRFSNGHSLNFTFRNTNPFPYSAMSFGGKLGYSGGPFIQSFRQAGRAVVSGYRIAAKQVLTYGLNGRFERLIDPISSTVIIVPAFGGDLYNSELGDVIGQVNSLYGSVTASIKTGLDFPLNTLFGVKYSRSMIKQNSSGGQSLFGSRRSAYFFDPFLEVQRHFVIKISNTLYQFQTNSGALSRSLIADVEATYRTKDDRFLFRFQLNNLTGERAFTQIETSELLQTNRSSMIIERFAVLATTFSF